MAALDSDKRPWRRRKSEEDGHELTETAHSPMTRGIAMPRGMCVVDVVMDVGRWSGVTGCRQRKDVVGSRRRQVDRRMAWHGPAW